MMPEVTGQLERPVSLQRFHSIVSGVERCVILDRLVLETRSLLTCQKRICGDNVPVLDTGR